MMNSLNVISLVGPAIYLTSVAGFGIYLIILAIINHGRRKKRQINQEPRQVVRKSGSDTQLREVVTHR